MDLEILRCRSCHRQYAGARWIEHIVAQCIRSQRQACCPDCRGRPLLSIITETDIQQPALVQKMLAFGLPAQILDPESRENLELSASLAPLDRETHRHLALRNRTFAYLGRRFPVTRTAIETGEPMKTSDLSAYTRGPSVDMHFVDNSGARTWVAVEETIEDAEGCIHSLVEPDGDVDRVLVVLPHEDGNDPELMALDDLAASHPLDIEILML